MPEKTIKVMEEEYAMLLEALCYTRYVKFLNEEAIEEYRKLGIKLGNDEE